MAIDSVIVCDWAPLLPSATPGLGKSHIEIRMSAG